MKTIFLITSISLILLQGSVSALESMPMSKNLQSTQSQAVARTIMLTLPIKQPKFHWIFLDKKSVFEGKMTLTIKRKNNTQTLLIFSHGHLSANWQIIPSLTTPSKPYNAQGMYFQLKSTKRYLTAPNDQIILHWHVPKTLKGIGPCFSGQLMKGDYHSRTRFNALFDHPKLKGTPFYQTLQLLKNKHPKDRLALIQAVEYKAYLDRWPQQWSLSNIDKHGGWLKNKTIKQIVCS